MNKEATQKTINKQPKWPSLGGKPHEDEINGDSHCSKSDFSFSFVELSDADLPMDKVSFFIAGVEGSFGFERPDSSALAVSARSELVSFYPKSLGG